MVGLVGIEPTTPALSRRCSNRLSYRPQSSYTVVSTADKCGRKNLNALEPSSFLGKSSLVFNGAYIVSKVKLGANSGANQSDNRPLQGQSPYILNASYNYNDTKNGLQVNLSYNIIGKRIYAVGNNYGYNYPDWYEMPRNIIDLTFSKRLSSNIQLKGGVSDILNNKNRVLQDGNQDGRFDARQVHDR